MRRFGISYSFVLLLLLASGADAATYYVRNGGNDAADGRSHATAWATIGRVNGYSFSAGDSVLFHEGHVFTDTTLVVDWNGTSSQHAVIGAYYLDGGTARKGFRTARPAFDGQDRRPATRYAHLLGVTGDRVRVENVSVVNSEGRGIVFNGADFGQVVNVRTSNTYDAAIKFMRSNDALIEGNYVTDSDRAWYEDRTSDWGVAISAHNGSARAIIRRNVVSKVFGEGINVYHNAPDALIEDNFVFSARAVGIYADSSPRPTIRRNIVVGSADSKYWRTDSTVGGGIVLSNESYHYEGSSALSTSVQTKGARIYNNLVAYTAQGIAIWGQIASSSFDNTLIYNNTLVDNKVQFNSLGKPMPASEFVNNILYSVSANVRDVTMLSRPSGLTARNNYFSQGDPGAPFSHSGNRYQGLQLSRMTGWRDIREPGQVAARDFQPSTISATNGAGVAVITTLLATELFNLDFNSSPHNNPFDMGALRRSSGKTPRGPGALELTRVD